VYGVSATIASLAAPQVKQGHVAGWVGVSSGNGQAWIQTGVSAFPGDSASHVYVEIAAPNRDPQYLTVRSALPTGQQHRFAVLELAHRPGWWRAWLDGRPVTEPIFLVGSHGHWRAQATGESWNDNSGACNLYRYSFGQVELAAAPGGMWRTISRASRFQDSGYRLAWHSRSDFVAASVVRADDRDIATASPARSSP
jgi:hypothetical protein